MPSHDVLMLIDESGGTDPPSPARLASLFRSARRNRHNDGGVCHTGPPGHPPAGNDLA